MEHKPTPPGQGDCRRGDGWSPCDKGHQGQRPWGLIEAGSTGCDKSAIAAALSLAETGQGLAAPAAALTAVTPHCCSYNLALLLLPPPLLVPRAAVGESCEGFNLLSFCMSSWLGAPLLCPWLLIQPSPSANNLEKLVCTLHFKNGGEVASDHTSLFCLAELLLAGAVCLGDGGLGIIFLLQLC